MKQIASPGNEEKTAEKISDLSSDIREKEETAAWQSFYSSGRVEDYLKYCRVSSERSEQSEKQQRKIQSCK